MQVVIVDGKEVLKCPHCDGTGICKNSTHYYFRDSNNIEHGVMECGGCGRGVAVPLAFFNGRAKPPTCRVCSGTGYNRV